MALRDTHLSILLIEDNPGDAKLVEHHLKSAVTDQYVDDVDLTQSRDFETGLERLRDEPIDVLLLDLGLPESTGIETVDRAVAADISVPIVVLTGLDDREASVEAITRGAQDYLPKGNLDSDRLIRAIRYAIERHKQEQELHRQTEQMSFFNQILRHDMLNGMNVIRARGEILSGELDGDLADSAETIVEWSDDIIDLSRKVRDVLDTLTDEAEQNLQAVDLRPVAETAADRARSMGGSVSVDVPDALAVRADPLLADVLSNLAMNAVEHGADDPGDVHVDISTRRAGNRIEIRVADDGAGFENGGASHLFGHGAKGAGSTGSGFGLYFVDSMVDAYNGSVSVTESDDGGATFVVELPAAREYDD